MTVAVPIRVSPRWQNDDDQRAEVKRWLDAYDLVLAVCESPDRRIRLSDLAAATLLTRSSTARLTDRL